MEIKKDQALYRDQILVSFVLKKFFGYVESNRFLTNQSTRSISIIL